MTQTAADTLRHFHATLRESGLDAHFIRHAITRGYMSGFTLDRLDELRTALASSFDLLVQAFEEKLDQGKFPLLYDDEVRRLLGDFPLIADLPVYMMTILWEPWVRDMVELRAVKIITDSNGPSDDKTSFLRATSTRPAAETPVRADLDTILSPETNLADKVAATCAVWSETYPLHENPSLSITDAIALRESLPILVSALETLIAADVERGRQPLMTLEDLPDDLEVDLLVSMMGASNADEQRHNFIRLMSRCLLPETGIMLEKSDRPDTPDVSFSAIVYPTLENAPGTPKLTSALARVISTRKSDARKKHAAMTAEDILEKIPSSARPALTELEASLLGLISQGAMPHLVTGPLDGVTLFGHADPRSVDIFGLFRSYMRKAHELILQGRPLDDGRLEFWLETV